MKKLLLAGMATPALSGCGIAQQQRNAAKQQAYKDGVAACIATIPAQVGNYVLRGKCINAAASSAGYSSPAEQLAEAERLSLDDKVDRGEMAAADAALQFSQFISMGK